MLDVSDGLDLSVFAMAPSCVPTSTMETSGASLDTADLVALGEHPRVLGLAEMMNFPGVLAGDDRVLDKLQRFAGRRLDGHAPGLTGDALEAYVGAGISSDHESITAEEAREKLRLGMTVFLREASNARNLIDVLPAVTEHTARRCAFATDDRVPGELLARWFDRLRSFAWRFAAASIRSTAVTMATLNPAEHYGLRDRGAVAPGRRADLVVTSDLRAFRRRTRVRRRAGGRARRSTLARQRRPAGEPARHVQRRVAERSSPAAAGRRARVIGIIEDQLLTTAHVDGVRRRGRRRRSRIPTATCCASASSSATTPPGTWGWGSSAASAFDTARWLRAWRTIATTSSSWPPTTMMACWRRAPSPTWVAGSRLLRGEVKAALALPIAGLMADRAAGGRWPITWMA